MKKFDHDARPDASVEDLLAADAIWRLALRMMDLCWAVWAILYLFQLV